MREMWLQVYMIHVQQGVDHENAIKCANEAVAAAQKV